MLAFIGLVINRATERSIAAAKAKSASSNRSKSNSNGGSSTSAANGRQHPSMSSPLPTVHEEGEEAAELESLGVELTQPSNMSRSGSSDKSNTATETVTSSKEGKEAAFASTQNRTSSHNDDSNDDSAVDAEHDEVARRAAAMTARNDDISSRRRRVVQDHEKDDTHGAQLWDVVHFPLTFWILLVSCLVVYGKL